MVRTVGLVAVTLAAVAGAVPATAKPVRYREVTATYTTPGGVAGVISGDTDVQGSRYGSATLPTRASDRTVTVSIADTGGTKVAAEAAQDTDGDGTTDATLGTFCGATTAPLRLAKPGVPVFVYVNAGSCGGGASLPTTGTVTARLYAR
jgi:hypothetical protein